LYASHLFFDWWAKLKVPSKNPPKARIELAGILEVDGLDLKFYSFE
jgi:hypothetical protein